MSLVKVSSGKILEDKFNNGFNSMWDILPYNPERVRFNENSIVILPGEYIEMLLDTPSQEFEMYAEISYISLQGGDEAGVLMKSVTGHIIESEFSYNKAEYNKISQIKIRRNAHDNVYVKASEGSFQWKDYGNTYFYDGHNIGFFNDSFQSELEIKYVCIYKNNFVTINGVKEFDEVKLYVDGETDLVDTKVITVNRNNDRVSLDLANCPMPLRNCSIVINEDTLPVRLDIPELYGGDVFDFLPDMNFTIQDQFGEHIKDFDLGMINHSSVYFTVTLHNNSYHTKHGNIVVEPVSIYDRGEQMVFLHTFGSDFSCPSKEIYCTVQPYGSFKCILEIKKDSRIITIDDNFNFKLCFV